MSFPVNYLGNNIFQPANPKYVAANFVAMMNFWGFTINQNKTIADFTIAFNAVVVGNQTVNFIPTNPAFQFPESEHFLITALRGFDGANATLASTDWAAGISDALTKNGTFSINNNGTNVQVNQPFTRFQVGTNWPEAGWFYLSVPILWQGQTNLFYTGNFPTATATANYNVRVEFSGIKLI